MRQAHKLRSRSTAPVLISLGVWVGVPLYGPGMRNAPPASLAAPAAAAAAHAANCIPSHAVCCYSRPISLHAASQQMPLVIITRIRTPTPPLLPPMPPFFCAAAALHIAYRTIIIRLTLAQTLHNNTMRRRTLERPRLRSSWQRPLCYDFQIITEKHLVIACFCFAPQIYRRAFGASRVFACFQNQREVFRSCGASPCCADPSAALVCGTH